MINGYNYMISGLSDWNKCMGGWSKTYMPIYIYRIGVLLKDTINKQTYKNG